MNTKEQGDIGVAQAIYYYTLNGYKVSIPNTDSTRYDLIVDKDGRLYRVQCKTTFAKARSGMPIAGLRTMGGNQSWNGVVKRITEEETDLIWICVDGKAAYEFPVKALAGRHSITLNNDCLHYAVMGDALLAQQANERVNVLLVDDLAM